MNEVQRNRLNEARSRALAAIIDLRQIANDIANQQNPGSSSESEARACAEQAMVALGELSMVAILERADSFGSESDEAMPE
jgi:hypothetical protein